MKAREHGVMEFKGIKTIGNFLKEEKFLSLEFKFGRYFHKNIFDV